jgi:hypothetical protein
VAVDEWLSWQTDGVGPMPPPGASLKRRPAELRARPAVQRGMTLTVAAAKAVDIKDPKVFDLPFNQKAR